MTYGFSSSEKKLNELQQGGKCFLFVGVFARRYEA